MGRGPPRVVRISLAWSTHEVGPALSDFFGNFSFVAIDAFRASPGDARSSWSLFVASAHRVKFMKHHRPDPVLPLLVANALPMLSTIE
jgi:hypothetical protein